MKKLLLISLSVLIGSCSAVGIRNYEEPKYRTLDQEEKFEVRQYSDVLVAQTTSPGTYKESSAQNFERLAGYIFGKNKTNQKLDMTTPVLQEQQSEKMDMTAPVFQQQTNAEWTMTFVLPNQYTSETAPTPLDESVTVRVLPRVKVATLQYSGRMNENNIREQTKTLKDWIKQKGFNEIANPYSAAYDPPWTLPMLRKNEIHIPIE